MHKRLLFTVAVLAVLLLQDLHGRASSVEIEFGQSAGQPALSVEVTATSPMPGAITPEMANTAAASAARIAAMESASRSLTDMKEVRFALSGEATSGLGNADPLALAYALLRPSGTEEKKELGEDPKAVVKIRFVSPSRERFSAELSRLTQSPVWLDPWGRVARMEAEALSGYSDKVRLLGEKPLGTALASGEEILERYQVAEKAWLRLNAARRLITMLPTLETEENARNEDLQAWKSELEDTLAMDQDNYLTLTLLARVFLCLELPTQAERAAIRALAIKDDYAEIWNVKAAAMLLLHRPALALADFSRAISLAPDVPEYYYSRAAVYLALDNEEKMCADLKESCNLGLCQGLEWAHAQDRCP